MALTNTADGGIARHLPQGFDVVRQQHGFLAHARAGERSLGTRMTPAYNHYIKDLRKVHGLLATFRKGSHDTRFAHLTLAQRLTGALCKHILSFATRV